MRDIIIIKDIKDLIKRMVAMKSDFYICGAIMLIACLCQVLCNSIEN